MEFPCRAFLCACGGRYAPPPHAWGIQRAAHAAGRLRRFIPTCVGNTAALTTGKPVPAVHPHMRGEYFHCRQSSKASAGSSPHAWGIRKKCSSLSMALRFIPTCVGNTERLREDRVEHHGSSPHAWGILFRGFLSRFSGRFIPTYVGNTTIASLSRGTSTGSSPHAWGIQSCFRPSKRECRFIPTCVGNTAWLLSLARQTAVHPHMRGEYSSRKHEEFSMVIIAAKIYRSGTA